jgi:hypothetical protein
MHRAVAGLTTNSLIKPHVRLTQTEDPRSCNSILQDLCNSGALNKAKAETALQVHVKV